jgi:two-component system sensor histidine kinase DesK
MASVWLVFLIFPLSAALSIPEVAWRIAAVLVVAAFGVFYFWIWRKPREDRTWANLGALALLTCASYPLIGLNALSLVPFLVAYSAFAFSTRVSYALMALWLSVTAALLAFSSAAQWWFMILPAGIVALMTGVIRFIDDRQQQFQDLQDQYVVANERERIARDLHDLLGQSLTAIALKAQVAERMMEVDPEAAVEELQAIQALSRRTTKEVRDAVGVLQARDLVAELAAAREVLAAAGISLTEVGAVASVEPACQQPFAWALREAITNVARHSGARACVVTFEARRIVVDDDGVGHGSARPGNGLRGLSARIAERGGTVTVSDASTAASSGIEKTGDKGTRTDRPGTRVEVTL